MVDLATISVSVLALAVSGVTAWLTLLRRGTVRMTQPTVIYFGPDAVRAGVDRLPPKIYLRTLLFSTAKRGRVIESMHASLQRNESFQNFNIWVHGEDKLVIGSGLFVGECGVIANHHFLTPADGNSFQFLAGRYKLDVYARIFGDRSAKLLFSQALEISNEMAEALKHPAVGLYFNWGPDSSCYIANTEIHTPSPDNLKFMENLGFLGRGN
jgi:hypothetical protein